MEKVIPEGVAQDIAWRFDKTRIIVLAYDDENRLQVVTYGDSAEDKTFVVHAGEECAKQLGDFDIALLSDDFRKTYDAARCQEAIELIRMLHRRHACVGSFADRIEEFLDAIP